MRSPCSMTKEGRHVHKPEPRWQALLAFAAVGAIYPT